MHPQIETYLERVERQLKSLPPQQCAEEIREMSLHLQSLVEEGRERGLNENEAVKAAITQFGSHRKVGRELCRAIRADAPGQLPRALSVLAFFMLASTAWQFIRFGFTVFQLTVEGHLDEYFAPVFWPVCFSLIISATKIYTAISLRQLRPWAFWMALLLSIFGVLRIPLSLAAIIRLMNKLPPQPGNWLTFYFLSLAVALLTSTCCVLALVVNRESFFRASKLR